MNSRREQALSLVNDLIGWRRHLHQEPEVGLALPDTHRWIAGLLRSWGLQPEVREAGITVQLRGSEPAGVTTVLRADMDALPVAEATGLPFSSRRPSAMHACGHDFHMAMLLGATRILVDHPPRRDTVVVFQPGEESDRGAVPTLEHDNLALTSAEAFAVHVHALWDSGVVYARPGTFMAFGDWFEVRFHGVGGHASQPQLAGNPIVAGSKFTTGLLELSSSLQQEEHVVATVTEFLAGNSVNVIPTKGGLRGTLRSLSSRQRDRLMTGLREVAERAAADSAVECTIQIIEGYPAVECDPDYVSRVQQSLASADISVVAMAEPSMVIEDFSYFLHRWPGAMVYLGAAHQGATAFNHSAEADFDEAVLPLGVELHLRAADGFEL